MLRSWRKSSHDSGTTNSNTGGGSGSGSSGGGRSGNDTRSHKKDSSSKKKKQYDVSGGKGNHTGSKFFRSGISNNNNNTKTTTKTKTGGKNPQSQPPKTKATKRTADQPLPPNFQQRERSPPPPDSHENLYPRGGRGRRLDSSSNYVDENDNTTIGDCSLYTTPSLATIQYTYNNPPRRQQHPWQSSSSCGGSRDIYDATKMSYCSEDSDDFTADVKAKLGAWQDFRQTEKERDSQKRKQQVQEPSTATATDPAAATGKDSNDNGKTKTKTVSSFLKDWTARSSDEKKALLTATAKNNTKVSQENVAEEFSLSTSLQFGGGAEVMVPQTVSRTPSPIKMHSPSYDHTNRLGRVSSANGSRNRASRVGVGGGAKSSSYLHRKPYSQPVDIDVMDDQQEYRGKLWSPPEKEEGGNHRTDRNDDVTVGDNDDATFSDILSRMEQESLADRLAVESSHNRYSRSSLSRRTGIELAPSPPESTVGTSLAQTSSYQDNASSVRSTCLPSDSIKLKSQHSKHDDASAYSALMNASTSTPAEASIIPTAESFAGFLSTYEEQSLAVRLEGQEVVNSRTEDGIDTNRNHQFNNPLIGQMIHTRDGSDVTSIGTFDVAGSESSHSRPKNYPRPENTSVVLSDSSGSISYIPNDEDASFAGLFSQMEDASFEGKLDPDSKPLLGNLVRANSSSIDDMSVGTYLENGLPVTYPSRIDNESKLLQSDQDALDDLEDFATESPEEVQTSVLVNTEGDDKEAKLGSDSFVQIGEEMENDDDSCPPSDVSFGSVETPPRSSVRSIVQSCESKTLHLVSPNKDTAVSSRGKTETTRSNGSFKEEVRSSDASEESQEESFSFNDLLSKFQAQDVHNIGPPEPRRLLAGTDENLPVVDFLTKEIINHEEEKKEDELPSQSPLKQSNLDRDKMKFSKLMNAGQEEQEILEKQKGSKRSASTKTTTSETIPSNKNGALISSDKVVVKNVSKGGSTFPRDHRELSATQTSLEKKGRRHSKLPVTSVQRRANVVSASPELKSSKSAAGAISNPKNRSKGTIDIPVVHVPHSSGEYHKYCLESMNHNYGNVHSGPVDLDESIGSSTSDDCIDIPVVSPLGFDDKLGRRDRAGNEWLCDDDAILDVSFVDMGDTKVLTEERIERHLKSTSQFNHAPATTTTIPHRIPQQQEAKAGLRSKSDNNNLGVHGGRPDRPGQEFNPYSSSMKGMGRTPSPYKNKNSGRPTTHSSPSKSPGSPRRFFGIFGRQTPQKESCREKSNTKSPNKKKRLPSQDIRVDLDTFMSVSSEERNEFRDLSLVPMETLDPHIYRSTLPQGSQDVDLRHVENSPRRLAMQHLAIEHEKQSCWTHREKYRDDDMNAARIVEMRQKAFQRQRRLNNIQSPQDRTQSIFLQKSNVDLHNPIGLTSTKDTESTNDSGGRIFLGSCVVCNERERSHIAQPCNHFYFCGPCSEKIKDCACCPICGCDNVSFAKVYT